MASAGFPACVPLGGLRWFQFDVYNKLGLEVIDLPARLAMVSWLLMVSQFVFHWAACVGFDLMFLISQV